jgi:DNA-binding IclR family transcriptional regulator
MHRAPVKSAARVLEIFEFFNERKGPLSLKEITDRLGYPQSSTTVLLKSLIVLGYVNYDRKSRTYLPSLKLASIGSWIADHVVPRGPILELMQELRQQTGETIGLAVQNDIYVQYLRVIDSDHLIRFHIPEGSMRLLTHSSFGLLFLSLATNATAEKMIRHINAAEPDPKQRQNIPELLKNIEQIRRVGYCFIPNMPMEGAGTVSMLLPWDMYGRPLAVGVGGYVGRVQPRMHEIIALMRAALSKHGRRQHVWEPSLAGRIAGDEVPRHAAE